MRQQRPSSAAIAFDPGYGRSVRTAEFERPMMSDDVETAQTVCYMEELASFDAGERSVVEATHRALAEAGIGLDASPREIANAIFWFLKRTITYVPTPGTSIAVDQTLIAPSALLAKREGDCAQFSMLAAAMFRVACIPCWFKTIAADRIYPDIYSHVYNVVETGPNQFIPFDSSNGPEPGLEYFRRYKERIWPRTIPDRCSSRPTRGTKGKAMLRSRPAPRGWRNAGLRGSLGDISCDVDGNCFDSSGNTVSSSSNGVLTFYPVVEPGDDAVLPTQTVNLGPLDCPGDPGCPGAGGILNQPASSTSSSSVFSTIANDLTSLATPVVKSLTTPYYNAQGQLINPLTGQVVQSTGLSALTSSTGGLLLLGLGGIALFALLASGKK